MNLIRLTVPAIILRIIKNKLTSKIINESCPVYVKENRVKIAVKKREFEFYIDTGR